MSSKVDAPKSSLESVKGMLKFLDMVPQKYKVGPWSPAAHMVVFLYAGFVILSMSYAIETHVASDYTHAPNDWIQTYRLIGGLYGFAIAGLVYYTTGIWVLGSYTLTSWNLMSIRLFSAYLAGVGVPGAAMVADVARYPALIGCSITVSIWWLVLVPLIDYLLSKDTNTEGRQFFWKWNSSAILINVHLVNLPLVAIDFLASGVTMTFFDLWMALSVALIYVLFYLNVMDPHGLHFYIILTPRTWLSCFSYVLILAGYYAFYRGWNHVLLEYPL